MLTIRKEQLAVFRAQQVKRFEVVKLSDLATRFPSWYARMGEAQALRMIHAGMGKARGFGITEANDLSTFIDLMVRFGEEFDSLESISWETEALRDVGVPDDSRVDLLLERLGLTPEFGEQEGTHVS